MALNRLLVLIAAFAAAAAVAGNANALAAQSSTALTCMNPTSGAHWQITVDYDRSTVDSNPAHITDAEISWRDAKENSNYTLDRKSGALTTIVPSSTGGYFVHNRCETQNPG